MSLQNDPRPRVRQSCAIPSLSGSVERASACSQPQRRPLQRAAMSLLAAGCLIAALPDTAMAGAWTQPQGDTLVIVKALHSDGRGWFDDSHHRTTFGDGQQFDGNGRSRQDQLNVYVEHGLTDQLSVIGNFYFTDVGFSNHGGDGRTRASTTGFADQEIGLRYALPSAQDDVWRSSVQALVSIPAYGRSKTYHPNTLVRIPTRPWDWVTMVWSCATAAGVDTRWVGAMAMLISAVRCVCAAVPPPTNCGWMPPLA